MLHTSSAAAERLGVTRRQFNRSVEAGAIIVDRAGDTTVVSDRALTAAKRSVARGRRWNPRTARAALELISTGVTKELAGSERSRLKARLRSATASELAYQLLPGRVSLWRRAGASTLTITMELAQHLELAADRGLNIDVTDDPDRRCRALRLVKDAQGDTLLVEAHPSGRLAAEALGLYAFGGARESAAASNWMTARLARL